MLIHETNKETEGRFYLPFNKLRANTERVEGTIRHGFPLPIVIIVRVVIVTIPW